MLVVMPMDSRLVTRLKTEGQGLMTYGFPPGTCGNDKIVGGYGNDKI